MDFFDAIKGVTDFLSGGENSIIGTIKGYFPASMTELEKSELSMRIKDAEASRDLKTQQLVNEATAQFNNRIKDMEGTASDLKSIPFVGTIIIFLRGCQRPAWGFATLWFDYLWLFSPAIINDAGIKLAQFSEKQEMALIVINILVLGFLFGERAVKNLMPLIMKVLDKK